MTPRPGIASGSRAHGGRGPVPRTLVLAALCAGVFGASASGAGLSPNPANDPRLLNKPIEESRYDEAQRCRKGATPGARALARWLGDTVRGERWGINRCERLKRGGVSVHAEGRAVDWRLDAADAKERRSAMRLIRTLIAPDRDHNLNALARRMGVQGLIFDCRDWWAGMESLGKYSYCYRRNGELRNGLDRTQAHRDHVHVELNWPGARKRTSFWRSPLAP